MPAAPLARPLYPTGLYAPPDSPDLADAAERRRLAPAAFRAFLAIMRRWGVRDEDARTLLGGVANGTFYAWKGGALRTLDQDRLLRISYLIGIYKSLNILFSEELADRWIRLPNSNPLFRDAAPRELLLREGLLGMQTVRRLLDARRGG